MTNRQDGKARASAPTSPQPKPKRQPTQLPEDEFAGVGGSYVIENGVRRRVEGPPLDATAATPEQQA